MAQTAFNTARPAASQGLDPELAAALTGELERQECNIELIASENYASRAVLAAQGSVLTNKYAEGYPGKRYYGGCEHVDVAERLAIERAQRLFDCGYANVQPHSGSQANAAAYLALAAPGATIMGLSLDHGGHLTHGAKPNFSGMLFRAVQYGVDDNGRIDFDQVRDLARRHRPAIVTAGFSAYSRAIDWRIFREICDEVDAYFVVDMAHVAGLVAAGLYPDPLPHAHLVTTTTHKTLRGPRGGLVLAGEESEITRRVNSLLFPGLQGGPQMHAIAGKAAAFHEALSPDFRAYQSQVVANARTMAGVIQERGFDVVSGGTDNHLVLMNVAAGGLDGRRACDLLDEGRITVNKNAVPNDPLPVTRCSGIRIGTPAITTRGFRETQAGDVANGLCDILDAPDDQSVRQRVAAEMNALCRAFPVYG
ncbi:serine hydroxymethyltransferase [Arhodomonas sp. AD133]|uniref:serine hydroxymethyltransferase n=1 Tax=Arhodomonas sp. AD133 TaxID=3415009 RepID=UPI003EBB0672